MAEWNVELPDQAVEGADTHVDDHNQLVEALTEIRANVDEHQHDAADITSGTLAAARIPAVAQSKVTGLAAKLADFEDRLKALEAAAPE